MRNNPLSWKEHAVSSTFVKKKHQSSGAGYNLLKRMLKHLPDSHITLFFGQTQAGNTTMINLGEKLGFKKVGVIPILKKRNSRNKDGNDSATSKVFSKLNRKGTTVRSAFEVKNLFNNWLGD